MASSARIDEIKKKFDENPRRYFAPLANEFRKAGDLEQAILICEEFLPQQAGHMSGHIVYGQALYEAGRLPESRTVFETALGLDPENLIALRHLGDIARVNGNATEARRWYDRVLEADPRNDEIQGLLQSMDTEGAAAPAPVGAPAPADPHAPEHPALSPIDLEMDVETFAPPPLPPHRAPAQQSTEAGLTDPPAGGFPWGAPEVPGGDPTRHEAGEPVGIPSLPPLRAEGLEPAEFEVPSVPTPRAQGLEPAEFEAPAGGVARAAGLESSEFDVSSSAASHSSLPGLEGSFASETSADARGQMGSDASLPGREDAAESHPPADDEVVLPMLDLDEGFTVAPHGDAESHPAAAASGTGGETSPSASHHDPGETMLELPPQVIAAESALMDVADEYGFGAAVSPSHASEPARAPFVTETMAELYLKQGFAEQALGVYRQLASAAPDDARLRDKVAELERDASHGAPVVAGPTVRDFLFRLATRRPNERTAREAAPSPADFASFEAIPEPAEDAERATEAAEEPGEEAAVPPLPSVRSGDLPGAATASGGPEAPLRPTPARELPPIPMPSRAERGVTAQGGVQAGVQGGAPAGGSIDALFGGRAASTSEDSAASALAQAFGGTAEAPTISGRPAHAASAELSLDSVFRDGPSRPPRVSQGFAFDQFFSESAADTAAPSAAPEPPATGEPAERGADDVKQFNSWLQGLKPR